MKSAKLLTMFSAYCHQHPEERFWQALANWAGYTIFVGRRVDAIENSFDTFFWEDDFTIWPR